MLRNRRNNILTLLLALLAMTACDSRKVYDSFLPVPIDGWREADALCFDVKPVEQDGSYDLMLNVRYGNSFPYLAAMLAVDVNILPENRHVSDTIRCDLMDDDGHAIGDGVNIYERSFQMSPLTLHANDSLHITVKHCMWSEFLVGIRDVGVVVRNS